MLYQNYTVKDLSNLPAEYILKEIDFVKKMNRRLKDKLYWRYEAKPDSRGEMYLIYDDILKGWAFLADARDVLQKRGVYKTGIVEQRLIDKRAAYATVKRIEYEELSVVGLETLELDVDEKHVKVSSTYIKGEGESDVRKDVVETFLRGLSELHIEEWKKKYKLLGEAYMTDVPSWSLVLILADGTRVRYSGRGDYPYNFFKLKDSVHRLMKEVISE